MNAQIKFGTSGWRVVIADDLTVDNVSRAVTGISRYVVSQKPSGARVIVGRDPRYMGERFVDVAAEILATNGITPLVIAEAAPTPAISYEVIRQQADGAINFTGSHSPPEYNGIKFSTPDGAPALPEVTQAIEKLIPSDAPPAVGAQAKSEKGDPKPAYLARLREVINLPLVRKSGLKFVFDPLSSPARSYSDVPLPQAG